MYGQFGSAFTTDTDKVDAIAQDIVLHERPAYFEGLFGSDLGGIKLAISRGFFANQEVVIMFMSVPADDTQSMDDLREEMRRSFDQSEQQDVEFEYRGSRDIKIAGETMVGTSDTIVTLRQDSVAFESVTGGIGFLMVVAPDPWFDESAAKAFFISLE